MKTKIFPIRMTEGEMEVLERRAKEYGLSKAAYVRELIGLKTPERPVGRPVGEMEVEGLVGVVVEEEVVPLF